jgi:hypothetical protein
MVTLTVWKCFIVIVGSPCWRGGSSLLAEQFYLVWYFKSLPTNQADELLLPHDQNLLLLGPGLWGGCVRTRRCVKQERVNRKGHLLWSQKCFRSMYSVSFNIHRHDDGGSTHLWNVGLLQRDYTSQHSRRLYSSCSPPLEREISHVS